MSLESDNVSASEFDLKMESVKLSFNDLSYVTGLKPDNATYLCGEAYWTGVEKEILGCNFKNWTFLEKDDSLKGIAHVIDNGSLRLEININTPDSFGCNSLYAPESSGEYAYSVCKSSSSSSSSGGAGVWDQSTWDNAVFGE